MNVYITYDRYEKDEWYSLYGVETNKRRAIKKFLEEYLPDFLDYGPDDCHSFQLQKVILTAKEYKKLLYLNEHGSDEEIKEFLMPIFDEDDFEVETLFATDGCTDNWEIFKLYCEEIGVSEDDEDTYDKAQEKFFNDDALYTEYMKKYIKIYY